MTLPEATGTSAAAEIADAVARLADATELIVAERGGAAVADTDIAGAVVAAARLFAAKADRVGRLDWPIETDALSATETVRLVTALLNAADINIFDMAIWYRRAE